MNRIPFSGGIEDVYWNEALGIWEDKSGKPTVRVLGNLEEGPLYIFGYGSLMWRPGDLLAQYPSYDVDAIEYQRLFAQRSTDHGSAFQVLCSPFTLSMRIYKACTKFMQWTCFCSTRK